MVTLKQQERVHQARKSHVALRRAVLSQDTAICFTVSLSQVGGRSGTDRQGPIVREPCCFNQICDPISLSIKNFRRKFVAK